MLRIQRAAAQFRDTEVTGTTVEMVKVHENKKHGTVADKTMVRTKLQKRLGRLITCAEGGLACDER